MFSAGLHHRHRLRLDLPPALNRAFDELASSIHRYRRNSSRALDELATTIHRHRDLLSKAADASENTSESEAKNPSENTSATLKSSFATQRTDCEEGSNLSGESNAEGSGHSEEAQVKSKRANDIAALATLIAVFADGLNLMCCAPNYPMMVTVDLHPDSFPSVPFDTSTSLYLLVGAVQIGLVVSNFLFGSYIAKELGSRTSLIILMLGSVMMTVLVCP